jgi:hypothetical protein
MGRGLGDSIERVTKKTGIKAVVDKIAEVFDFDCKCNERKEKLNKMFPYIKPNCLTEDEYVYLSTFNFNTNVIGSAETTKLLRIYNRVFNKKQKFTNCITCWKNILTDLQKIYNEYK